MRRTILVLLITLSCALPLLAQAKTDTKQPRCTLPLERAPELRGLRLGTPQASVLLRFPGTSLGKPDKFGITQIQFTVIDTSEFSKGPASRDKGVQPDMTVGPGEDTAFIVDSVKFPALKGVRRVRVRFVDGRLAYAQVAYDDSIKWSSIDEFVETVTTTLKLPSDWARPADSEGSSNAKELRCEGFLLTADVGSDSLDTRIAAQLSVEDLVVSKLVEKRQNDLKDKAKSDEDAKRKNFKP